MVSEASNSGAQAALSDGERNAMRTYLQRCEVRLSTLHRMALAFIGGAGLLLLIPVFFKDVIDTIIEILLAQSGNHFPALGTPGLWLTLGLYLLLGYALLLSLVIPLYAVYLLLKDIVQFYFTIYMPGYPDDLLNPTFALSALAFWPDESPAVKREIMRYQYQDAHSQFMAPFSENKREHYFDAFVAETEGKILPATRQVADLRAAGVVADDMTDKHIVRFNAAMGLARSLDRTLLEDVAITEMALVRHVLYLRRMVMRYMKTLLMFLWTTIIAFLMLPLLKDPDFPVFVVLSAGYLVWSVAVVPIMRLPVHWIYRHRKANAGKKHIDKQLRLLEDRLYGFCLLSIGTSLVALVLSLAAYR